MQHSFASPRRGRCGEEQECVVDVTELGDFCLWQGQSYTHTIADPLFTRSLAHNRTHTHILILSLTVAGMSVLSKPKMTLCFAIRSSMATFECHMQAFNTCKCITTTHTHTHTHESVPCQPGRPPRKCCACMCHCTNECVSE